MKISTLISTFEAENGKNLSTSEAENGKNLSMLRLSSKKGVLIKENKCRIIAETSRRNQQCDAQRTPYIVRPCRHDRRITKKNHITPRRLPFRRNLDRERGSVSVSL